MVVSWIQSFPLTWLWFLVVFLISGLIVNFIQLLLLPLWFITPKYFRWINAKVGYLHWSYLTFVGEWWSNMKYVFYGKKEDFDMMGKENAIVLPNHRSDVDWLIGWVIAGRANVLGTTKCYMKGYLKFVPLLGWAWWCAEYVFLKRSWEHDEPVIKKYLSRLREFPIPFWMVIFAEGTRFTEEKHKCCVDYAKTKGIPVLKHHLLPRTKGFAVTVKYLKNSVPAIYDVQLVFPDKQPTLQNLISAQGTTAHIHVRRIPLADIPTESSERMSEWCHELYQEKDELMECFIKNGKFPAPIVDFPRKRKNLFTALAWQVIVGVPIFMYIVPSFVYGSLTSLGVALGFVLFGWVSMQVFYFVTDTKRSSSFGLNNTGKKTS